MNSAPAPENKERDIIEFHKSEEIYAWLEHIHSSACSHVIPTILSGFSDKLMLH